MFRNRKNFLSVSSLGDKKQLSKLKKIQKQLSGGVLSKRILKNLQNSQESTSTRFFSTRVKDLSCFHVNSAKFVRTPILQNKSERLLYKTMFIIEFN